MYFGKDSEQPTRNVDKYCWTSGKQRGFERRRAGLASREAPPFGMPRLQKYTYDPPPLIVWPRLRKRIYRSFSPFKVWPNGIVKPALSETRDYSVYQRIRGINSFNPFCPERNERATLFCDNRVWFYLHLNFTLYFIIWC